MFQMKEDRARVVLRVVRSKRRKSAHISSKKCWHSPPYLLSLGKKFDFLCPYSPLIMKRP